MPGGGGGGGGLPMFVFVSSQNIISGSSRFRFSLFTLCWRASIPARMATISLVEGTTSTPLSKRVDPLLRICWALRIPSMFVLISALTRSWIFRRVEVLRAMYSDERDEPLRWRFSSSFTIDFLGGMAIWCILPLMEINFLHT